MHEPVFGDAGDVVLQRHVRDEGVVHPQKSVDVPQQAGRVSLEVLVEVDPDLLGPEHRVVARELPVIEAPALVVPAVGPVLLYASLLGLYSPGEVREGLLAVPDLVQKLRVGPLDGIPQDGDQPRLRHVVLYARGSLLAVEVQGRRLADNLLVRHPLEQRLVGVEARDGLSPRFPVARTPEVRLLALEGEELGLLDRAHEDLRVLVQVVVERGRPGLGRPYHEKVGHLHAPSRFGPHLQASSSRASVVRRTRVLAGDSPQPVFSAYFRVTPARAKKKSVEGGMYQCHSRAEWTR